MRKASDSYIPALRYRWLTRFYDPVVAITSREKVFKRKLLDRIVDSSATQVLDLACGTGTLARLVKIKSTGTKVHGLDGDPGILEIARQKAHREGLEINFDEGLSFSMPYEDHKFDLVVSSLFFHHLTAGNKKRTLLEVHRVLKPGGRFLVCDWGKPSNPLLRLTFYLVQILDGFAVTRDNVQGRLPEFIKAAGFTQVALEERISTMLGTLDIIIATGDTKL